MGAFGDFLISVMREAGFAICHQMPARSLHYAGRALPVCARDTGIFLGFTICLLVLAVAYWRAEPRFPSWPKAILLGLFLLPTIVDALTSYAGLRESSNAVRLVTGTLAGVGVAALLFPFAAGALAVTRRLTDAPRPRMLEPWWSLPALLAIPALLPLAMWPSWPGAFWIWSVAVTLSIVFTFLALNFTLITLLFEWWKSAQRVPSPGWLAAAAAAAAIIELAASNRLHWLALRALG